MQKKYYRYLLTWAFWALVFVSCSLEKRRYFKGYYNGKIHHYDFVKRNSDIDKKQTHSLIPKEFTRNDLHLTNEIVVAEKSKTNNHHTKNHIVIKQRKEYILNDTCKDELVFKNGERLRVKIVEITPYVVRFYNCTMGSPYISEIPKNDLSVILPHNDKAEFIDSEKNNNSKKSNNSVGGGGTKIHEEVLIGLVLFSVLWFVGVAYILVRYKPVRNEILSNPNKYHGKKLWDVLFYLSIAYIAIVLLYIFFIFVIFGL